MAWKEKVMQRHHYKLRPRAATLWWWRCCWMHTQTSLDRAPVVARLWLQVSWIARLRLCSFCWSTVLIRTPSQMQARDPGWLLRGLNVVWHSFSKRVETKHLGTGAKLLRYSRFSVTMGALISVMGRGPRKLSRYWWNTVPICQSQQLSLNKHFVAYSFACCSSSTLVSLGREANKCVGRMVLRV